MHRRAFETKERRNESEEESRKKERGEERKKKRMKGKEKKKYSSSLSSSNRTNRSQGYQGNETETRTEMCISIGHDTLFTVLLAARRFVKINIPFNKLPASDGDLLLFLKMTRSRRWNVLDSSIIIRRIVRMKIEPRFYFNNTDRSNDTDGLLGL